MNFLKFLPVLFLPAFSAAGWSQTGATFEANNVRVGFNSNGAFSTDLQQGVFIPLQPGLPELSLLRASGLWIAGVDPASNLKGAIQLYNTAGKADFTPGTLDETGQPAPDLLEKIWPVSCGDILQHLADLADNGVLDQPNPRVLGWPAQENPFFSDIHGIDLPTTNQGLAGFNDHNDDLQYNPLLGDYPSIEIRGCPLDRYPDEMAWFAFHDNRPHTQSSMNLLQMEVQAQVFAYRVAGESPLNQAVFVRYKLINRATELLDSVFVGLFADFDLGQPGDDFIGSAPAHNMMYGYNGDANDEGGFGAGVPAMGVAMMRSPLQLVNTPSGDSLAEIPLRHVMPIDNPESLTDFQFYNLLNGRFPDGTPAPNNGLLYTGNPNDPEGWSEVTADNKPGQRAALASFGPFDLHPGAVNELIVAYFYAYTPGASPEENVQALYDQVETLRQAFDNCFASISLACEALIAAPEPAASLGLTLFPNPAAAEFVLESAGGPFRRVRITGIDGRLIREVEAGAPVHRLSVPIHDLAAGMYLVQAGGQSFRLMVER